MDRCWIDAVLQNLYNLPYIWEEINPSHHSIKKDYDDYVNNINSGIFKKLSKETNIKIIGSYDASSVPCDDNEFYDYMHPKDSCMKKITNSIN